VVVLVGHLKWHGGSVWLDVSVVEEHLVDFLVGVGVWTAQIVGLTDGFLHLQAVHDGEGNITHVDWLNLGIHALNLPVHSVEHLHVHAPLGGEGWILMKQVHHVCWTQDGHIWADSLDLLLTNPLGAKTLGLRVGIGTSCGDVDESLDFVRVLDSFGNGHWDSNVRVLEVLLLLVENLRADATDDNIRVTDSVLNFSLRGEIIESDEALVTQISCGLQFLKTVVPD